MFTHIEDSKSVNYEGKVKDDNVYAVTITSRKSYDDALDFRKDLYVFLSSIKYRYSVRGVFERHNQKGREDKLHVHGITYCGNPPKCNKTNQFYFKLVKITNLERWISYCLKDS